MKKILIIGAGSWGTALANHVSNAGHDVEIYGRDRAVLEEIEKQKSNSKFFPGLSLSKKLKTKKELANLSVYDFIVFATPSSSYREIASTLKGEIRKDAIIVSASKGLEDLSYKCLSQVLEEELKTKRIAVLSGPSFAKEVIENKPTAVTLAAEYRDVAEHASELFHFENFRVYLSRDVVGAQLGGALKNVVALATGISDGMGCGHNARAALIARGLAEMTRVIVAAGGDEKSASGLSGLGDLILTSTGDLSRNRRVGLRLGQGEALDEILKNIGQVAEGVVTADKAVSLAKKLGESVPICEEVNLIIKQKSTPGESLERLFSRSKKEENAY